MQRVVGRVGLDDRGVQAGKCESYKRSSNSHIIFMLLELLLDLAFAYRSDDCRQASSVPLSKER